MLSLNSTIGNRDAICSKFSPHYFFHLSVFRYIRFYFFVMYKYPLFLSVLLLFAIFSSCSYAGVGEADNSTDSCYTVEYIGSIGASEPRRALELLDSAEKQQKMSLADINGMRALIYYNWLEMADMAIISAGKAYDYAKQYCDSALMLKSLKQLAAISFKQNRYAEAIKYAIDGLSIATALEDRETAAYMMQFMGTSISETESVDEGLQLLDRSIAIYEELAGSDKSWSVLDNYLYGLCQKANVLVDNERNSEAIDVLHQAENALSSLASCADVPHGVADMRSAELYALFTMAYLQTNKRDLARAYAKKCSETNWSKTPEGGGLLLCYLIETEQYDAALRLIKDCKEIIASDNDTLTRYYVNTLLKYEADCYEGKGDLRRALEVAWQIKAMTDSLYIRENKSNVSELSALYKNKDLEFQLLLHHQEMARHKTIFIFVAILFLVLGGFVAVLFYYNRKISRKNMIAAAMIRELTETHDEQRMQRIADFEPQIAGDKADSERQLFDRIDQAIVGGRLFLHHGFNREEASALVAITPKHLSALFQRFANGFPDYINSLRLEYAVTILKSKPNYTIEGISQECGFSSRQTFHRLFVEKYGMTPSEFRACPDDRQ